MYVVVYFFKNQMTVPLWDFSASYILFYWSTCLFWWWYHSLFITMALSIIWNLVLYYFLHCSFCLELFWLFTGFYIAIWILGLIFLFLWKMPLGFGWELNL
jgi:hypothetical protein